MSGPVVRIADRWVGEGQPIFIIAEIGINHNGSLELTKKLIDGAALSGVDAVKFQKRDPEACVPREQWGIERDTPWGRMTYLDYRRRMEFGEAEFAAIDRHCRDRGMPWFASCWDEESVDFMERFDPPCHKAASACLTDHALLARMKASGRPLILSTGMSTMDEIDAAVEAAGQDRLLLAHATSTYPCPVADLNLRMLHTLQRRFPGCPVGYSDRKSVV